jgi:hypothetical protein
VPLCFWIGRIPLPQATTLAKELADVDAENGWTALHRAVYYAQFLAVSKCTLSDII